MTCTHEPIDPVPAFSHVCRHCGACIEPVPCFACHGFRFEMETGKMNECPDCKGTGAERWEEEK